MKTMALLITVNYERKVLVFLRGKSTKHQTNYASNIDENKNTWVMISTYTQWVTKPVYQTQTFIKLKKAIKYNTIRDVKFERNINSK